MYLRNSFAYRIDGQDGVEVLVLEVKGSLLRRLGIRVPGEIDPSHGSQHDRRSTISSHLVDAAGDGRLRSFEVERELGGVVVRSQNDAASKS